MTDIKQYGICDAHASGVVTAYVRVTRESGGELWLCAHCWHKHEVKLRIDGWNVTDNFTSDLTGKTASDTNYWASHGAFASGPKV